MSVEKEISDDLHDMNLEEDVVKVVQLLTTHDANLPLKTEIDNVMLMTTLDVLTDNLKDNEKMNQAYKTLNAFRNWYRVNAVSGNRQSRKEVIEALRTLREYSATRLSKWLGKSE